MDTDPKPTPGEPDLVVLSTGPRLPHQRLRPSENHVYFDAVARHGSIRKAADALHIASSALNRRILDLESEVGTALFERLPRGVRLTSAGELLLSYVRSSLKELRKLEAQIDLLRGQLRGAVRVAVAESVTPTLLPRAIADYQRSHAGVAFHVAVGGPDQLADALQRDTADLIITHQLPERPATTVLAVYEHPLVALVVPGHPLTRMDHPSLVDCAAFPLALPDHSLAARHLLDAATEESGLSLRATVESDSIETLRAFARLGDAVAFNFRLDGDDAFGLVAVELTDARCADARMYLAVRRGRVLPVAAAAFAETLRESIGEPRAALPVSVA